MAAVTGSLMDIVGAPMANRAGKLVFRLNAPNIQTSAGTVGRINPTEGASVTPSASNGFFTVDLEPTTVMLFEAWYSLEIHWLDAQGGVADFPWWQIRVTSSGGPITNLITLGPPGGGWGGPMLNLSLVLIDLNQPPNLARGQLWWKHHPTNPNDPGNTGEIYLGR